MKGKYINKIYVGSSSWIFQKPIAILYWGCRLVNLYCFSKAILQIQFCLFTKDQYMKIIQKVNIVKIMYIVWFQ